MYTETWNRFYDDWQKWLGAFAGQPASGIEIGVFEGRSTVWLFEHILTHPDSRLVCIDPFAPFDGINGDYETRFNQNTQPYQGKIALRVGFSKYELPKYNGGEFDFVIIDGSHTAIDVATDAIQSWVLLKRGGVMIFDDYAWTGQGHEQCAEHDKPRIAINAFIDVFQPEILHAGYQMIVRKP